MCIRDRYRAITLELLSKKVPPNDLKRIVELATNAKIEFEAVSYTHLRAHETVLDLVCRLLLEKKKKQHTIRYMDNTQQTN